MVDFSVAIPTYNGVQRLPKLLERLRSQVNTDFFSWEIIVVDNNSTDNTAELVKASQADWQGSSPSLRYVFESQQGAAFARQKAMQEAQSEWVGFLDDDVIPDANWVASAYRFSRKHPQAGAYGGQIHGEFEVPPPKNFKRIQSFLAIRERGSESHLYEPESLSLPPSAAWAVRRRAWLDAVPNRPTLGGRANGSMLQGDDYEPLLFMHKAGWEIWYNPDMHVHHLIPQQRLEKAYLLSLIRGSCLCICHLRMINTRNWQKPIVIAKIMLGSLHRLIQHRIKYWGQISSDLVATCEAEFHFSSFMSPFYFLKTAVFDWKK